VLAENEGEVDENASLKLVHDSDAACARGDKSKGGGGVRGPKETMQKA
jgi:hypothetical protein